MHVSIFLRAQARGWKVVSVPYWDWISVNKGDEEPKLPVGLRHRLYMQRVRCSRHQNCNVGEPRYI
jgi:hypothetical protein